MNIPQTIDLTYLIESGMPRFEAYWHPEVSVEVLGVIEKEGRMTRKLQMGTHTGTHIDAPTHFIAGGQTLDTIPCERLIGPVKIIDLTFLKENQCVTPDILQTLGTAERMIMRYGWGRYWKSEKFYRGYPFLSKEAALYLVKQGVRLLGMDTPSPDDSRIDLSSGLRGTGKDSPIHKILLGNGIILVEYIANLDQVKKLDGWSISALPMKIKDSDGSPARVVIFR